MVILNPVIFSRLSDDYDTLDSATSTPRGYLPPGTHSIPHTQDPNSRSMSTSISGGGGPPNCTYGRRPTPRPSSHSNRSSPGFGARLGYAQNHSGLPANPYRQQDTPRYYPNPGHLGPIFPEEEDDTFFPPDTLPPIDEAFGEYRGKGGEEESVDFLGNPIGYPQLSDEHSRAKFEVRLAIILAIFAILCRKYLPFRNVSQHFPKSLWKLTGEFS